MSAPCPVFGFVVQLDVEPSLPATRRLELEDAFAHDCLWPRGLVVTPTTSATPWSYVVKSEASQAVDADRAAVEAWTQARPEIRAAHVGPLADVGTAA